MTDDLRHPTSAPAKVAAVEKKAPSRLATGSSDC